MTERRETDGLVTDAIRIALGSARRLWERLSQTTTDRVEAAAPVVPVLRAGAPATLVDLGVPRPLADEMELVMRLVRDPRFTFVTTDGVRHRIVLPEEVRTSRAA